MLKTVTSAITILLLSTFIYSQSFVGSQVCKACHDNVNSNLGYNIWTEFHKSGHPYKLNPVNGAPPQYPANTSPGVPSPPPASPDWNNFAYVIGGYGWKARFVKTDGFIFTDDAQVQYNLENGQWVPYHQGQIVPYNYNCFKCHTTGPSPEGSWNGNPSDSLGTFSEPGIRCEGCHGPGSDHIADPTNVKPPITGINLQITRCGDCHQRGGTTNSIPASGGYIQHHEQLNEMRASKHGDGVGVDLTCASCHDTHIAGRYPQAAGSGLNAIKVDCATCHPNHEIVITKPGGTIVKPVNCEDCHMPAASKSAVGMQVGNGFRGDVPTHIWQINTLPVPRDSMFTSDGKFVKLDADGHAAVTLDFVCLTCHSDRDLSWAASYADSIHTNGIIVGIDEPAPTIANEFKLFQNYPNPFNPSTTIEFTIPSTSKVTLSIYNISGQKLFDLIDHNLPAGYHSVKFSASELPSGIYIYALKAGSFSQAKKMVVLK